MRTELRSLAMLASVCAAWAIAPSSALAQSVYGYSSISVSNSVVNMYGYTEIDYASSYYYTAQTDVYPQGSLPGYTAISSPGAGRSVTAPAVANASYWVQTNHWVRASGSDPNGFGRIVAQYYNGSFNVSASGVAGGPGNFWVGTSWVSTSTYGSVPSVTYVDQTTYGNMTPGSSGYIILYGNALTANWANPALATQVSIRDLSTQVIYEGYNQVNIFYTVPAGTAPGPRTGTLTTPYGTSSFTVTVNPKSQTITFPAISNVTWGTSAVTVAATASSGLTVTFSSDTPGTCFVSGTMVGLVSVGTCTIRAKQPGGGVYAAAPDVTRSFSILQAAQTITFNPLSGVTMGVPPFGVTATATSGLAVSFVASPVGVCTVSASTVTVTGVGTCTVTASQAGNGNYSAAAAVSRSFAVAAAASVKEYIRLGPRTVAIEVH